MANDYCNVIIASDFQYTTAEHKAGLSEDDFTKALQDELLEYQLFFEQGKWLDSEIDIIAKELVETGKMFARNQGFGDSLKIGTRSTGTLRIMGTGNLVNSIKANPVSIKGGKSIEFYNDAVNERGQHYAGHLEYGFHDRGGNFIPARPFMRPALYAVAEGSKANFSNIMEGLLSNLWTGKGFQGISTLTMGRMAQHRGSNFWAQSKSFSKHLSRSNKLEGLKGSNHRQKMSMMRPGHPKSVSRKSGYKLTPNKRDYYRTRSQSTKFSKYRANKNKTSTSGKTNKTGKTGKNNNNRSNKTSNHKPRSFTGTYRHMDRTLIEEGGVRYLAKDGSGTWHYRASTARREQYSISKNENIQKIHVSPKYSYKSTQRTYSYKVGTRKRR